MMQGFGSIAQLTADFTASLISGCSPLNVQFTDKSTGNPQSWTWDLGNGSISMQKDPGAIYITPGTYTVTLTVKNASGENTVIKTSYITVYPNPVAEFMANSISGCTPLPVKFTDKSSTSSGFIKSWLWDFGDGTSSPEQNPFHIYNLPDTFTVSLFITNSFGCTQSLSKSSYIAVADTVNADFSYSYSNLCSVPTPIQFNNLSGAGPSLTYSWNFGDGTTSAAKDPAHTYTQAGTYNIVLVATNSSGCIDSTIQTIITGGSQQSDFVFLSSTGCINESIVMKDASSVTPTSSSWDFGDGTTATGLTATHVYAANGTYTVTHKTNFGDCSNSVQKNITIVNKPVASFTSSANSSCSLPINIHFTNTSDGASVYSWNFGDSTTSVNSDPSHTYTSGGSYTVKLIAYNGPEGCSDTLVLSGNVNVGPPHISGFAGLPFTGCASANVPFKANIITPRPIDSYYWYFGDGDTSTSAEPVHHYVAAGNYTVKLIVKSTNGCTDSLEVNPGVIITENPVAAYSAVPENVCASTPVHFTNLSTGGATTWQWVFGDGDISFDKNPVHSFQDTGYFSVILYAENNGCIDSVVIPDYIHIQPPVARFNKIVNCSNNSEQQFLDGSVAPQSWNWDFGDGVTSFQQSPMHNYADTGLYNVQLVVTNGGCTDTAVADIYVLNENVQINAASQTNFCKMDSIAFSASDYTPSYIATFQWVFGDGSVSAVDSNYSNIKHKYQNAGSYNPSLITIDINGCTDTVSSPVTLKIYGPTADFSNGQGTCIDSSIVFNDNSFSDGSYPVTKWIWDYGDGQTETLTGEPFTHVYQDSGIYGVKLSVFDTNGCMDTLFKPDAIMISKPGAGFSLLDSARCASSDIVFLDSSAGFSLSYEWNFGDNTVSNDQSPVHQYAEEGFYSVSLKVTDKFGCTDSLVKPGLITIANPVAAFTISDSTGTCPPLPLQVINNSKNYSSVFWDFGDENTSNENEPFHLYTVSGEFTLKLIAKGLGECFDTATRIINLKGPNGTFLYTLGNGCYPVKITFDATTENTTSYIWDFGDGSTQTSSIPHINYNYKQPGSYVPKVILQDRKGCKVPIESADTIKISGVLTFFKSDVLAGCDSSLLSLTDSSILTSFDALRTREWSFGDGSFSNDPDPRHYYKSSGNYKVSLSITTDSGCIGKYVLPVTVSVNESPAVKAIFPDSVCVNTPIKFIADDTANIPDKVAWLWQFDNGDSSDSNNPVYTYTNSGLNNITLIGSTSAGCSDTARNFIRVLSLPQVKAGSDTYLCRFQSLDLHASGALNYTWKNSSFLSCINCQDPQASPDSAATFYVTGTDAYGCNAADSISINVIQPVSVEVAASGDTLCVGGSVTLNASGADEYTWQPSGGLNNANIPNPVAAPLASTGYTVTGSDSNYCFSDTATASVYVAPLPVFNIIDSVVTVNVGSPFTIETTGSPDIVSWLWTPAIGLTCSNCADPVAEPHADITYTAQASTIYGCTASDDITIHVMCNNTNIYIPNTFSPNADNHNDYFYPRGTGLFTIKNMRIFNRWGTVVFAKKNFAANEAFTGWDGKVNGTIQKPDVYVYIIDVICDNGTVLSFKGNVTLIR